jgi:hypothetical protein
MTDSAWAARLQAVFELSPTATPATKSSGDQCRTSPSGSIQGSATPGLAELRAGRSIRNVEARFRANPLGRSYTIGRTYTVVMEFLPAIGPSLGYNPPISKEFTVARPLPLEAESSGTRRLPWHWIRSA